jgi:hypothetical protein
MLVAALVLDRFRRNRKSWLEPVYAAAFAAFGFSDFVEAYELTSVLIAFKGSNLLLLLWMRRVLLQECYPHSRMF